MGHKERIRQMAVEAGLDVRDDWCSGGFFENVEKFAQAVARECMQAVRDAGPKGGPMQLVTDGFVEAIRARFGLEG